jgi:carbamoyltransferase
MDCDSPYMLLVAPVRKERRLNDEAGKDLFGIDKLKFKRSTIPAVTHVDYSARVQTIDEDRNPVFYRIIKEFERKTSSAVVINTSFNIRGEPIVCSSQDAYRCFMCTDMDYLLVGHYLFERLKQPNKEQFKKEDITTFLD